VVLQFRSRQAIAESFYMRRIAGQNKAEDPA